MQLIIRILNAKRYKYVAVFFPITTSSSAGWMLLLKTGVVVSRPSCSECVYVMSETIAPPPLPASMHACTYTQPHDVRHIYLDNTKTSPHNISAINQMSDFLIHRENISPQLITDWLWYIKIDCPCFYWSDLTRDFPSRQKAYSCRTMQNPIHVDW